MMEKSAPKGWDGAGINFERDFLEAEREKATWRGDTFYVAVAYRGLNYRNTRKAKEVPEMRGILYILLGYLLGSILFAKIFGRLLGCGDVAENSADQNPGTFNAFQNGGFLCGTLTLCGDILKGFLPVWMYLHAANTSSDGMVFALVLAAPVIGHIFPLFHAFRGGNGIATTFGCLLGLLPNYVPLVMLACCFIVFSCIIRVSPHYYRTLLTYFSAEILTLIFSRNFSIVIGFTLIALMVGVRLWKSDEEKQAFQVGVLWRR